MKYGGAEMIKIKKVDVSVKLFNGPNFMELSEVINELGKDRILHITSAAYCGSIMTYTIFYEDDD